jgi:hypothetical protein
MKGYAAHRDVSQAHVPIVGVHFSGWVAHKILVDLYIAGTAGDNALEG